MNNFCTNCGAKIRKGDNFCTHCGTKIDKSDMAQNNHLNSASDTIEKKKAKKELKRVVGERILHNKNFANELHMKSLEVINTGKAIRQQVEKEIDAGQIKIGGVEYRVNQLILEYKIMKQEENKRLKMVDDLFESEEIKSEIRKNIIDQTHAISIKDTVKNKLINKQATMNDDEIKYFIKTETEKEIKEYIKKTKAIQEQINNMRIKEKEMKSKKIKENERISGGYCDLNCQYCYEELFDSGGGVVGDLDSEGYTEYYCHLGHSITFGRYCEDYK